MSLRAGPYTFSHVTYDAPSDVLYAAIDRPRPARASRLPRSTSSASTSEGRFFGLTLVNPREQLRREGAVYVSLPSGERVRVQGAEAAIRAAS